MPTRPSVNMLCQISGRPAIQLKLWNCLKRCIDNSLWYETFKLWWSCKKILPRKSCCLGREQSDNSSSTDSPNWPTNDAWHVTGPGTWGETDAFQKPSQLVGCSQLFYSCSWKVPLRKVSLLRLTLTWRVPVVTIHIKGGVGPWSPLNTCLHPDDF